MKDTYLREKLSSIGKEDLKDIIIHLLETSPDTKRLVLERFKEKEQESNQQDNGSRNTKLSDELLLAYWEIAQPIIFELNGYDEDEDPEYNLHLALKLKREEVYKQITEIFGLIYEEELSTEAKFKFIDGVLREYWKKNSGFEDMMIIMVSEICKTRKEWQYLIKKLAENAEDWEKQLIKTFKKEHLK